MLSPTLTPAQGSGGAHPQGRPGTLGWEGRHRGSWGPAEMHMHPGIRAPGGCEHQAARDAKGCVRPHRPFPGKPAHGPAPSTGLSCPDGLCPRCLGRHGPTSPHRREVGPCTSSPPCWLGLWEAPCPGGNSLSLLCLSSLRPSYLPALSPDLTCSARWVDKAGAPLCSSLLRPP